MNLYVKIGGKPSAAGSCWDYRRQGIDGLHHPSTKESTQHAGGRFGVFDARFPFHSSSRESCLAAHDTCLVNPPEPPPEH